MPPWKNPLHQYVIGITFHQAVTALLPIIVFGSTGRPPYPWIRYLWFKLSIDTGKSHATHICYLWVVCFFFCHLSGSMFVSCLLVCLNRRCGMQVISLHTRGIMLPPQWWKNKGNGTGGKGVQGHGVCRCAWFFCGYGGILLCPLPLFLHHRDGSMGVPLTCFHLLKPKT